MRRCPQDPAFVQCLRLMLKEEQYLAGIGTRLLRPQDRNPRLAPAGRGVLKRHWAVLGLRYHLASAVLNHLLDLRLAHIQRRGQSDPATLAALDQIIHDRNAQLAFTAEWLTKEFADFNFLRRNLRRMRLRLIFAAMLVRAALADGPLLHAAGSSCSGFALESWAAFRELLERMVPYHRDVLLAELLAQREHPYDKPRTI